MGSEDSPVSHTANDFPRTIWLLWHQGWENAPELVKSCLRSWQYHNPGWTIRALDAENLPAYVDLSDFSSAPDEDFTLQAWSDIVRIELLHKYGGVWADAACFCRRPLDEWLFDHLDSGLFGFGLGQAPLVSFLAAAPGNRAMDIWLRETRAYWIGCPPRLRESLWKQPLAGRVVERLDTLARYVQDGAFHPRVVHWLPLTIDRWIRRRPSVYFSPLFRNVIKYAPYGWLFLLFKHCYAKHPEVRRIWDTTPKMSATYHFIEVRLFNMLTRPLSDDARRAIDDGWPPLYVTDWRVDMANAGPGTFLYYLLATITEDDCEMVNGGTTC